MIVFGEDGDVILEWEWDPETFVAYVGDTLVRVPVFCEREGLGEHVVEIGVVREDDVAAYVEELFRFLSMQERGINGEGEGTHEALGGCVGCGEAAGFVVAVNE